MERIDRRVFLVGSAAAAATLAAWPATRARGHSVARSPAIERVAVVDRGIAGSTAFVAAARAHGLRLFEFESDAAHVWMHELEPRLRSGSLEILGHTCPATRFCLELLARDYGADVVQLGASSWLIATSSMRRAPLMPQIQQRQG
jgi:hypothetical protein